MRGICHEASFSAALPADESDSMALINAIGNLPDKQYKECMAGMDPVVQMQVVYQMSKEDKKTLEKYSAEFIDALEYYGECLHESFKDMDY